MRSVELSSSPQVVDANNIAHFCQVLNGIAWDAGSRRLWLTGKRWPVIYQVELRAIVGVP